MGFFFSSLLIFSGVLPLFFSTWYMNFEHWAMIIKLLAKGNFDSRLKQFFSFIINRWAVLSGLLIAEF